MSEHEKWFFKRIFGLALFVCALFIGCAGSSKEPTSQPSVEDVRGDSDRFFNTMEKEEKNQPSP